MGRGTFCCSAFCNIWPGSCLPTKFDLIRIYGKFGKLNKWKTEMFNDNFCAQIGFRSLGDALEAFKESPWKNNFTNPCFYQKEWIPHVTFRLLNPTPEHVNLFPTTNRCCFSLAVLSTVVLWPLSKNRWVLPLFFLPFGMKCKKKHIHKGR